MGFFTRLFSRTESDAEKTARRFAELCDPVKTFDCVAEGRIEPLSKMLREFPRVAQVKLTNGMTFLHVAASYNQVAVIRLLLSCGADVNATSNDGVTPLHSALIENQDDAVQCLVEHGASPSTPMEDGMTPLGCAVLNGSVKSAAALVKGGADPNAQYSEGVTILNTAIMNGNINLVRILVAGGASPTFGKIAPLQVAHSSNRSDIADLLRSYGARE